MFRDQIGANAHQLSGSDCIETIGSHFLDGSNILLSVDLSSLKSLSRTVHTTSASTDLITAVNHFLLVTRPVRKLCLEKTMRNLFLDKTTL